MGLRFSRHFKVIPGIRFNLSNSGVSTSVGRRGAWFTIGPKGTRSAVRQPGSGLSSYTDTRRGSGGGALMIIIILLVFATFALC